MGKLKAEDIEIVPKEKKPWIDMEERLSQNIEAQQRELELNKVILDYLRKNKL